MRISYDPNDNRLGVTRQLKDCRAKAKTRGWTVVEVFEDNDVSASTGKRRKDYERMLDAIRAGAINAVVVWDLDRLTRRPIEIEQFIELADQHGVELASVGGDIDLATDTGRLVARIMGAAARHEVDHKSRRQKAAAVQRREMGLPHLARRGFGYTADRLSIVPEEAAALRRAAEAVLAGDSLASAVRVINAEGVLTAAGGPWHVTELRRALLHPRYAALMSHYGQPTGGKGNWPAILDEETHAALRAVLGSSTRSKPGRPHAYLLSGIATCGKCGAGLYGAWDRPRARGLYRCRTDSHLSRASADLEAHIVDVTLERLGLPDAADRFTRPETVAEARELRQEEQTVRARKNGLAEAFAAGAIDLEALTAGTRRVTERLAQIHARLSELVQEPDLSGLVTAEDREAAWAGLPLGRQRTVLWALFESIVVHPAGRGARRFDPATVEIRWRG